MDWTGYPIAIDPDIELVDLGQLALFLGGDVNTYTGELLRLIDKADPDNRARLAGAYPRESIAYGTWQSTTPAPTGAELVDALSVIPDPAPEQPGELVSVQVERCMIISLPSTGQATVTLKHRLDAGQAWRQTQYVVPAPSVDVDPALLNDTANARLSVRLTVQDDA